MIRHAASTCSSLVHGLPGTNLMQKVLPMMVDAGNPHCHQLLHFLSQSLTAPLTQLYSSLLVQTGIELLIQFIQCFHIFTCIFRLQPEDYQSQTSRRDKFKIFILLNLFFEDLSQFNSPQ